MVICRSGTAGDHHPLYLIPVFSTMIQSSIALNLYINSLQQLYFVGFAIGHGTLAIAASVFAWLSRNESEKIQNLPWRCIELSQAKPQFSFLVDIDQKHNTHDDEYGGACQALRISENCQKHR